MVDPTWPDASGTAYLGTPLVHPEGRPEGLAGVGLFEDHHRLMPTLRYGLPDAMIAAGIGLPVANVRPGRPVAGSG
ncbi:hypothetical protein [Embleya sp. AB8]|uniref:hypothetical protein n=1 Tax=Embleya sp. AB8 TaxID=3156304 RepID=UPI003C738629